MTDRLADIGAQINSIRQLGAVVNAMRGIAAARAQQARSQLVAVDSYAAILASAMARAVALLSSDHPDSSRRTSRSALVLFCAEQGFAGAFSERVLLAVGPDLETAELFLVGTRGQAAAAEQGVVAGWACAIPSHSPGLPKLADDILAVLYARIATGALDRLDVVFSHRQAGAASRIERKSLFPLDTAALPSATDVNAPLLNLPPAILLDALTANYMHAQLCEAALHSFAAENETRVEAMAAARNQIELRLIALRAIQRLVRQEEITSEIIELAAGEAATRAVHGRRLGGPEALLPALRGRPAPHQS